MTMVTHLQVCRENVNETRWADVDIPGPAEDQIRLRVDRFAFTANNITYGVIGEQFGYWRFFPVSEKGWGIIPVWGFADITASQHPEFEVGERVYGYLPMATEFNVTPDRIQENQFIDASDHRNDLPAVYNVLTRVKADPFYDAALEDFRSLWFPLAGTSFGLADWLHQTDYQGADTICLVSASSKTALALAYLLKEDASSARNVVGVTSEKNKSNLAKIGYYDDIISYQEIETLNVASSSVIVDFSGNGTTLAEMHRQLGDNMKHTVIVGASHWEEERKGDGYIDDRSRLFFMPAYAAERIKETDGAFVADMYAASQDVAKAASTWMAIDAADTVDDINRLYKDVKDGNIPANRGGIMSFAKL